MSTTRSRASYALSLAAFGLLVLAIVYGSALAAGITSLPAWFTFASGRAVYTTLFAIAGGAGTVFVACEVWALYGRREETWRFVRRVRYAQEIFEYAVFAMIVLVGVPSVLLSLGFCLATNNNAGVPQNSGARILIVILVITLLFLFLERHIRRYLKSSVYYRSEGKSWADD